MGFPNEGSMKAQARIRRAAEEQTAYLSQFSSWTNGIRERDSALREEAKARKDAPYRSYYANPVHMTDQTEVPKLSEESFVEEVSSIDDAELRLRKHGNDFYSRGEFQQAVKCYTRCLAINPQSEITLSNRAMAYLKLKQWQKAEDDANASLHINPWNVKSLQRRSAARTSLGKLRAALRDLHLAEIANEQTSRDKSISDAISIKQKEVKEALRDAVHRAPKRKIEITRMPVHRAQNCIESIGDTGCTLSKYTPMPKLIKEM